MSATQIIGLELIPLFVLWYLQLPSMLSWMLVGLTVNAALLLFIPYLAAPLAISINRHR